MIVGGGDGGSLREVVKYPGVEQVIECELDAEVVRIARRYFRGVASGYKDPRATVLYADGFDAIILDLTDPIGPAKPLFEKPFYQLCSDHLSADGFLSAQTESLHFHADTVGKVYHALGEVFPRVELVTIPLAMYPGNWWTMSVGSKSLDPKLARNAFTPETHIYSRPDHAWFFLPPGLRQKLIKAG